jgi:hypothetical protein
MWIASRTQTVPTPYARLLRRRGAKRLVVCHGLATTVEVSSTVPLAGDPTFLAPLRSLIAEPQGTRRIGGDDRHTLHDCRVPRRLVDERLRAVPLGRTIPEHLTAGRVSWVPPCAASGSSPGGVVVEAVRPVPTLPGDISGMSCIPSDHEVTRSQDQTPW